MITKATMAALKLVTVFGATGEQGSSVIAALHGRYQIRATTRNTTSKAAQALKKQGVEVVEVHQSSLESVKAAISGAYGVFAVTNYWYVPMTSSYTRTSPGSATARFIHNISVIRVLTCEEYQS